MMRATKILLLSILTATLPVSAAQLQPSSDLLLPRFEVDLVDTGVTTVFSVGNASEKPVEILATLSTNWGVPILDVTFALQPDEVRTVDLRDWLRGGGDVPSRAAFDPAHVAAAASGQASPRDRMYYGSEVRPGLAVGSVTLRTRSGLRNSLWGDWSVLDSTGSTLRGDTLVDIDRSGSHTTLCRQHLLRYGADTEVTVWREAAGKPSATPDAGLRLEAAVSEQGETRRVGLLALDRIAVQDLGVREPSGALRIETTADVYIPGAFCVTASCDNKRTALDVNILLNGRIANEARGPLVDSGSELAWTLIITNTGERKLSGIEINGLDASCPGDDLAVGESMECTAVDVALSNPQSVPVLVTGRSACAGVSARTTGYYEGVLVDVYP